MLYIKIEELTENNKVIDVLCITEHNMVIEDINQLCIPNYNLAAYSLRDNRSGGSCILVKNTQNYKLVHKSTSHKPNQIEYCSIELIEHNMLICCLYRPPNNK